MSRELDGKLKTALDESRLLILGAQILFGFTFEGVFQELFKEVALDTKIVQCAALAMMLLSIGCLIAPSIHHQIAYAGESRIGALRVATNFACISVLPLTVGLGASVFVIFDRMSGRAAALTLATILTLTALGLLYVLGFALRRSKHKMPMES